MQRTEEDVKKTVRGAIARLTWRSHECAKRMLDAYEAKDFVQASEWLDRADMNIKAANIWIRTLDPTSPWPTTLGVQMTARDETPYTYRAGIRRKDIVIVTQCRTEIVLHEVPVIYADPTGEVWRTLVSVMYGADWLLYAGRLYRKSGGRGSLYHEWTKSNIVSM